MDFKLTDDLDLFLEDNEITIQENGETTLIQAFFTDARIQNIKGYWLDIPTSEIWRYDQSRLTQETANNLNESSREIAKELVEDVKLYDRIETETFIDGADLILQIKAFDDKNIVVNRQFKI